MDDVLINITEVVDEVTITVTEPDIDTIDITVTEALQGEKGIKGDDGITPIKGVDYFDGDTPVKGVDYFDGDKGDAFTYEDFTPDQLTALKGVKGDAFTYSDFTPEQLALLKGDAFEYTDFTPEQLLALKGVDGTTPIKGVDYDDGEDGDDGTEIELQKTSTHIQWRYIGGEWDNLVSLDDIKGIDGEDGDTPVKGVDYFDGSDATVTKVAVEAVLTGDISTHSHSVYLTKEQIEGMI